MTSTEKKVEDEVKSPLEKDDTEEPPAKKRKITTAENKDGGESTKEKKKSTTTARKTSPTATKKRSPSKKTAAEKKTTNSPNKKPRAKRTRKRKTRASSPPPTPPRSPTPPPSPPGPPPLEHAHDLLKQVEFALMGIQPDLQATQSLLEKHHPPTILAKEQKLQNSSINNNANNANTANNDTNKNDAIQGGTGGHSNTNHQVVLTGDPVLDKLREYQRHYEQRQRQLVPETKGNERWDKPKVLGQRRRRIHREVDKPEAPQEPPLAGFTLFVGQMTTKIRHDRIHEPHHQPSVMQEIAKLWKDDMTEDDRSYYNEFAKEARAEYIRQQMEFRASGKYTPSSTFLRLGGSGPDSACAQLPQQFGPSNAGGGPWIRKNPEERNALEREISAYETVDFPLRPPQLDFDYQLREWKSKVNRRLKLRKLLRDYTNPIEQAIVEAAVAHAKHDLMDVAGETLQSVDHSAVLKAATLECVAKLQEMKRALQVAQEPPPPCGEGEEEDAYEVDPSSEAHGTASDPKESDEEEEGYDGDDNEDEDGEEFSEAPKETVSKKKEETKDRANNNDGNQPTTSTKTDGVEPVECEADATIEAEVVELFKKTTNEF